MDFFLSGQRPRELLLPFDVPPVSLVPFAGGFRTFEPLPDPAPDPPRPMGGFGGIRPPLFLIPSGTVVYCFPVDPPDDPPEFPDPPCPVEGLGRGLAGRFGGFLPFVAADGISGLDFLSDTLPPLGGKVLHREDR